MVIQTDPRAPGGGNRVQVQYKHRREIDRFFELPPELHGLVPGCMRSRLGQRSKSIRVRVTYDQKNGEVINKIIKARVADIDLHLPACSMDCRISVNLEMQWDGSVEELERHVGGHNNQNPDRNKDRLSYTHGPYQIDLTQVTQTTTAPGVSCNHYAPAFLSNHSQGTQRLEKEHELEIELAAQALIEQGRRVQEGKPHRYPELVEGFIDNVRTLARRADQR